MKKARTKKLRGGKRKLTPAPAKAKPEPSKTQQKSVSTSPPAATVAEKKSAKTDRPERQPSNVLKTQSVPLPSQPVETNDGATSSGEVEHWISMIREGGLDRKVKVKGKTGALLVR